MESKSIECLPKISLEDIPKDGLDFFLNHEQKDHFTIFHHECFTNDILYTNLVFDLPDIPFEDLPYVKLLLTIIPEIGLGKRKYKENLEYINSYLGDFNASANLFPKYKNANLLSPTFWLQGKALKRNSDKLFKLFNDACSFLDLDDHKRIKELIQQIHTSLESQLSRSAMSYAIQRSIAPFNQTSFISEYWSGIKYLKFIRKIIKTIDKELPLVVEKLKFLQHLLFHFTNPHLIISCDKDQYQTLIKENFYGITNLSAKPFKPWKNHTIPEKNEGEGYSIPSPVAFSALGFNTPTIKDPSSAALCISTNLLENTFLHKTIREKGGAYGTGANYSPMTGNYYFYGYRDPHIKSTFNAFENGIKKIADGAFTDSDLFEAKLGLIQDFDSPVSPGSRAIISYCYFREERNKDVRQQFREEVLDVKKQDIINAITKTLLKNINEGKKVTFTSENHIKKDGIHLPIISL